jgi:aminodeoxyfutalosine deaminase
MLLNSTFDSKTKPLSFLKFQADTIFTGLEALTSNQVLITNSDGKIIDIVDEQNAGDDIQQFKGIISPGIINCHCHLELSHLKNKIPEQTGMVDFILNILQKRNAADEIIQQAIEDAENEMIENGIVAVGDICNTTHTLVQKQKNNLYYHNFIEVSGFVPSKAEDRFKDGMKVFNSFHQFFPKQTSIVPHAPYSVSNELFQLKRVR